MKQTDVQTRSTYMKGLVHLESVCCEMGFTSFHQWYFIMKFEKIFLIFILSWANLSIRKAYIKLFVVFPLHIFAVQLGCAANYHTLAFITCGLYFFTLFFFHCGLYCRAVYNGEWLIFHDFFFHQTFIRKPSKW